MKRITGFFALSLLIILSTLAAQAGKISAKQRMLMQQHGQGLDSDNPACHLPSVHQIEVPIYPKDSNSPKFKYSFQLFPKVGVDGLTVVYLPGGPGLGSIGDWQNDPILKAYFPQLGMPANANILFFDPRGGGCNSADANTIPDQALTTDNLANDVLVVLKSLKIKNYILYGVSYGSQWATVTASLAEKQGLPPLAVYIGGVIGLGLHGYLGSISYGMVNEWNKVLKRANSLAKSRLFVEQPLGIDNQSWSNYVNGLLRRGLLYLDGKLVDYPGHFLNLLGSQNPKDLDQLKIEIKNPSAPLPLPYENRVFLAVDCPELSDHETDFVFSKGRLADDPTSNVCTMGALSRRFDPHNYPITRPIFYFQGGADPVLQPQIHTRYHVQSEIFAHRFLTIGFGGGHLDIGQMFGDCKEGLWASMAHGGQFISDVLKTCMYPHSFHYLGLN